MTRASLSKAILAGKAGIYNVFVTNGFMTRQALDAIQPYLDAANVDDSIDDGTGENTIEINDAIIILNFLFQLDTPPAAPFPDFGLDRTVDDVTECAE